VITNVLHTISFSLNFILYCIVSAQFRDICKGACYGIMKVVFSPSVALRRGYDTSRLEPSLQAERRGAFANGRRVRVLYELHTVAESRGVERRSQESRGVEGRSQESRGVEERSLESRGAERRSLESRGAERRSLESRVAERKSQRQNLASERMGHLFEVMVVSRDSNTGT